MSVCGQESGPGLVRATMVRHSPGTSRAMGTGIWQGWAGTPACLGGPRARQIQTGIIIDCHCTWHFPFLIIPKKFVDFHIKQHQQGKEQPKCSGTIQILPVSTVFNWSFLARAGSFIKTCHLSRQSGCTQRLQVKVGMQKQLKIQKYVANTSSL